MLRWTVPPTMTWQDLRTVDLQFNHGEEQPVLVRFSQSVTSTADLTDTVDLGVSQIVTPTDMLTLFDAGTEAGTGTFGTGLLIEGTQAALDLGQSRLESDGPQGQTVTVTLALGIKQPLAGKTFAVSMIATDDNGALQGPEAVGTLSVEPFTTFVPLVARRDA